MTATLTIDLGAVVANWRGLGALHSGAVAGVVKADGYGLGAREVAAALYGAGCQHFFVARFAEAVAIRGVVPGAMVAVLDGLAGVRVGDFLAAGVSPVLGSVAEVVAWRGAGVPAILHVDTGMNRLGVAAGDVAALPAGMEWRYVMTHLVASEVPVDPMNAAQARAFAAVCAGLPGVARSFANSSGIFLGAGYGSDLARPGAALYGINPVPGRENPMRGVVTLRAPVLQVRDVPAGATVGYNATWVAGRDSRIATVGVGYADGWLRSHSGRGHAVFDGSAVPLVGRVSMDLTTFDVTDVPGCGVGDLLELIGPGREVDAVAEAAGTNGYEVLTSLGARYVRAYLR